VTEDSQTLLWLTAHTNLTIDFSQKRDYNSLKNYDFNVHKKVISQQPFWKDIYEHKLAYKFKVNIILSCFRFMKHAAFDLLALVS